MSDAPQFIENRYFVELEEEDIQKLNRAEAAKFTENPQFASVAATVEAKLGPGEWSEHWITVDDTGKRVYARLYTTHEHTMAVTADGRVVRES
ncbi:MAG TPA: hypothetical protein VEC37_02755 [Bacillota bacterium]|nr:hypothetical protein [Bacillota bacterium]